MPLLPSDFGLPPLPHLAALLVAATVVLAALYYRRPPVTEETVSALAPWMAAGGTLYAVYQVGGAPDAVAPLFGSPAVYVTVGVLAGAVWAAVADRSGVGWDRESAGGLLAWTGTALLVVALGLAWRAADDPAVARSVLIVVAAGALAAATWGALRYADAVSVVTTGAVGVLTVVGHALDGVSTAVGYDHLGFGEQTPLSHLLLEAGAAVPAPDVLGDGWLFVLVKLALAAAVVALFDGYVREEPREGFLLLGLVAAVGLGPGVHNVVLFAIA